MKKISILSALLLVLAGAGLAGCQRDGGTQAPDLEATEPDRERGTGQMEPGEEERTGFGEEQERRMQDLERDAGQTADEAEQEWNENVQQPAERELNE